MGWMRSLWACGVVFVLGACSAPDSALPKKAYTHPTGLKVLAPATYLAHETERGFAFEPPGQQFTRTATSIEIELRKGSPEGGSPEGAWRRYWWWRPLTKYRIDYADGGSGGNFHTLRAWKRSGEGYLWLEQEIQDELPMFVWSYPVAWEMFDSVRVVAQ